MKKIAILGSTGSIGRQTLDVLKNFKDEYEITALAVDTNEEKALAQAENCGAGLVCVCGRDGSGKVEKGIRVSYGRESLIEACEGADVVVLAVTGISGLPAFEYALRQGKKICLATKEAMVCGGRIARELIDKSSSELIPIDSELSAIYQSMRGYKKDSIEKILLTGSGGPFRTYTKEELSKVTLEDALKHPTWNMGAKVTVDSATLMNKGLEIMETRWFFDVEPSKIEVVIHPESIIHSMVEYNDASIIAQLAVRDMRIPIHYAFTAPERKASPYGRLDLFKLASLHFEKPDVSRFPCLELAYEAVKNDGSLQNVLNSANEVAVAAFLDKKIGFADIPVLIEKAMKSFDNVKLMSFSDIYGLDLEVRAYTEKQIENII